MSLSSNVELRAIMSRAPFIRMEIAFPWVAAAARHMGPAERELEIKSQVKEFMVRTFMTRFWDKVKLVQRMDAECVDVELLAMTAQELEDMVQRAYVAGFNSGQSLGAKVAAQSNALAERAVAAAEAALAKKEAAA